VTIKSPALFALTLLVVIAPATALAGQPQGHCQGYYDTFEVVDCGGFSVMDDAKVFAHIKEYCDKDGNLTRSHVKLAAMDDFYRDDDPAGTHVTGSAHVNDRADYDEFGIPFWTPSPITVGVHLPGAGYLFLDVGMLDMHEDGYWHVDFSLDRFSGWTGADFDALCARFE